eukprot:999514-Rhodomonas_salina.1
MSLGAGVMERRAAVREVPRRFPFLQAVGADIRVGHSDSGKARLGRVHTSRHLVPHARLAAREATNRPQGLANTFAAASEVREL